MVCGSCGYENPSDARFCAGCGRSLAEQAADAGLTKVPTEIRDAPRQLANGRYLVKGFLGEGGRKRVYLAHDTPLDRDVAIALIKTDGLDEAGLAPACGARRRRWARLGDHPHVVTVFDVGEEDGQPYIVSQYMAGGAVDDLLRGRGRAPPAARARRSRIADEHLPRARARARRAASSTATSSPATSG